MRTLLLMLLLCGLAAAQQPITPLEGPDQLRQVFESGRGTPRLILFLSPT